MTFSYAKWKADKQKTTNKLLDAGGGSGRVRGGV